MLKLLSCVLSFTLIFTSVAPSLAQVPVRPTLRGGTKLIKEIPVHLTLPQSRYASVVSPVITQEALLKGARISLSLPHASVFSAGSSLPPARQILTHPDLFQRSLLQFYRAQLEQAQAVFSSLPATGPQAFSQEAKNLAATVADVAGLGLVGVPAQDAPLILQVYEKSVGTAAEPVMTAVCARALLRLQAYEILEKMSNLSAQQPELWQSLEQYGQMYGLPVKIAQRTRQAVDISFFEKEMEPLGQLPVLVIQPQAQATFLYMHIVQEMNPAPSNAQAKTRPVAGQTVAWDGQPVAAEVKEERFASQGAPFANQKPIQPVMAATQPQELPNNTLTDPSAPKRFRQVEVENALGNKVLTWEPADPVPPDVSSAARSLSWLDKARLQWAMRFKPAFQDMLSVGTSRYGLAALGVGMAPVTSEAAVSAALAADKPAIVQTVRAQQGTFIAEDFLRGGAGASYRTGVVNPGGMAAQRYAQVPALSAPAVTTGGVLYGSLVPFPSLITKWFTKNTTTAKAEETPVPGQEVVKVTRPLTRVNRLWAKVAQVPSLGFTSRFAQPKVDQVRFVYQQVWFNVKTQAIEYAQQSKEIPNGFRAFTISQAPLFVAPPQVTPQELDAVKARVTEEAEQESLQTGKPIDPKTLQARIEQEQHNLPAAIAIRKANLVAQYVVNSAQATRNDFVWVLASDAEATYKVQAVQKMNQQAMEPVTLQELLAKRVNLQRQVHLNVNLKKDELTGIAERVSSRLQQENLGQLVPQEDPLLSQGLTFHELTNVDQARLTEALYPQENMEELLRHSTHETVGGNTVYDKVLPVYVRDAAGNNSETVRLYLLLNKPFTMPRGFRVVLDESGHFKVAPQDLRAIESSRMPYNRVLKAIYKWQPNFLDKLPWVKNNPRRLRDWDSSVRRRVFETPLKASELTALNYILSNRPGQVAVLPTAPNDTFDGLMNLVAIVAGADLGASLSSQLKKTFSSEAATTFMSGGGYISPKIANVFAPLINKYGYYSILRGGFMTMLGISAVGMLSGLWQGDGFFNSGMWGLFSPSASTANMVLSFAFMSVAMVTASVFSMLAGPILKSTYTDPTIFSSKNMEFTTNKGLSRLLVTAGTGTVFALVKSLSGIDLNWSVLVPVMAGLSGLGLVKLKGSRLYAEHQVLKKEKAQTQEVKNLSREEANIKKAQEKKVKKEMKAKYEATFAKPLKSITNRLGLIYLTYGNVNSVILGILAGILYDSATAMYISGAGLFISWLVRKAADKLIKSRVITEDQLTGMSLPLMLAGVVTGLVAPFGSASMAVFFGLMYLSTPTFGVSENTRMMNYIASYYKAEREKVNKDASLSLAEKEAKLKAINKEQEAMKVQAASSYNSHNSWGVYPILATTALVALAKDGYLGTTIAQNLNQWFQYAASVLRMGTDAAAFDATKAESAPLDFAIYRLMLLPAVAFGLVLNWANLPMIKQGFKRLFSSIAVSKEDIGDVMHNDIPRDLQIDFKNINATVEELSKEVEELDASIRPFKDSRTSEERLQGWANRMVWVNNRLTALLQTKPILRTRLEPELRMMRSLSKSFMLLLDYNDVSIGLRQQGQALYHSLGAVRLENEPVTLAAKEEFVVLLYQLQQKEQFQATELLDEVDKTLENNDAVGFAQVLDGIVAEVSSRSTKNQLLRAGHRVLDEMKLPTLDPERDGLQYVPELKLSTVDALRRQLHLGKDPAKGIFAGSDVQNYEQAKLLAHEMQTMLTEAQKGVITDSMFEQFKRFYSQAVTHLQKYVKKNASLGQQQTDPRVLEVKNNIDAMYRQYMNQEPPAVSLGAERTQLPPTATVPAY